MHARSGGVDPGRAGCRVPLRWSGDREPFGFSPAGATGQPWLPQPAGWAALTVEAQEDDPASMLRLYRSALALRRREAGLGDGTLRWLDADGAPGGSGTGDGTGGAPEVLAFARGDVLCVVNLGTAPVDLPAHAGVLLTSADDPAAPLPDDRLPPSTAAWLRAVPPTDA